MRDCQICLYSFLNYQLWQLREFIFRVGLSGCWNLVRVDESVNFSWKEDKFEKVVSPDLHELI